MIRNLNPIEYLIYYLIKRKYLIGGIIMGFMFLLKENSYLLLPAACLLLMVNTHKGYSISLSKKIFTNDVFLLLIIILIPHDHSAIFATIIKSFKTSYLSIHDMLKPEVGKPEVRNYHTSSITSLPIFFKYFGVVFPLLLLAGAPS